jgi:hypothetical protein
MNSESERIWKVFMILSRHLPGGPEETKKNISQVSACPYFITDIIFTC